MLSVIPYPRNHVGHRKLPRNPTRKSPKQAKKQKSKLTASPNRTFTGKVNSLSAGTGATFSLLPADNATGNFTKVVQRVPVKIVFDPGQNNLGQLASGMSATATVVTR